jgi:membrane-associated phospholipid phosphatase
VTNLALRTGLAAVVTFTVGLLLSVVVRVDTVAAVDHDATRSLHDLAVESATVSDRALDVTSVGDPITLTVIVALVAGWLLAQGSRRLALWLVVVTALGGLTESVLKVVVGRARPDLDTALLDPASRSFPSGHAFTTTTVLGAVTVALVVSATSRRAGVVPIAAAIAASVALAVGLSRPVLGVHFVTDVVAGWLLAVLWLVLTRPRVGDAIRSAPEPPSG